MATFSVLRAQDVANATALVASITPQNWHKFPPAVVPHAVSNENAAKPRYLAADYGGNAIGDDVVQAKANIALARQDGAPNEVISVIPRTQFDKAAALGTVLAEDITRDRGWIAPAQPYVAKPATPGISTGSLSIAQPKKGLLAR